MAKNILVSLSRRAKYIRLMILPSCKIRITVPYYLRNKNYWIFKVLREKKSWIQKNLKKMARKKQKKLPKFKIINSRRIKGKELIEWAKKEIEKETKKIAQKINVKYKKIYIRSQKTIWGSCSRKGNLSLNYKITLLPKDLFSYVITHELCHLTHPHHQKDFWSCLKKIYPDLREKRKQLKKYSPK